MKEVLFAILFSLSTLLCFGQAVGDSVDCSSRVDYSWLRSFGGSENDRITGLAHDQAGNIYILGEFSGSMTVAETTIVSAGKTDFFIAKADANGQIVWLKSGGSSEDEHANSLAVDNAGNIFIVGLANNDTYFGGERFPQRGRKDGFLLKLDNDGNFVFARNFGSYLDDEAFDVIVDNSNNVVVTGYFDFMLQIGPTSYYHQGAGGKDNYIAKLDSEGEVIWTTTFASTHDDFGKRLACDANNNIYLAGEFLGNLRSNSFNLSALTDRNAFIVKVDAQGQTGWAVQKELNGEDEVTAFAITTDNNLVLAIRNSEQQTVLQKYSTAGSEISSHIFVSSNNLKINKILTQQDYVYLAGSYQGTIDFGGGITSSQGDTPDYYIVRYSNADDYHFQLTGNQPTSNQFNTIVIDNNNGIFAGGDFSGEIHLSADNTTSQGENDALLVKFERYMNFAQPEIIISNCDGNNMGLSINVIGGAEPYRYYWSNGSTTQQLTGLSAGSYALTVVDNINCYITATTTLETPQPPVINLQNSITICPFDTLMLTAPAGMQEYSWSTGANERNIAITQSGNYSLTVTSPNSCTASATTNITEYPVIDVIQESNFYFCPADTLFVNATGFQTYLWSNGIEGADFRTTQEGVFVVKAYNGICNYYDTITSHKYPQPTIELGEDRYFCEGESVTLRALGDFMTYRWSNGQEGEVVNISTEGYIKVLAEDGNGCVAEDSVYVREIAPPKLNLGEDTTYCTNDKVEIIPEYSCNNCAFLWSTGDVLETLTITETGSFWLRITNEYGCSSQDTININIVNITPFGLEDEITFCTDSLNLSSANTYETYLWNTGATSESIYVFFSGTYSVTVTDFTGCTTSSSSNVSKYEMEEPYLGGDTVFCGLDKRRIYLNTTYTTYRWSDGSTNPYIDIAVPGGSYSVSVTNFAGCSASASLRASFSDDFPTINKITSGKGLVTVEVSNGTLPYYYSVDGENWQTSNIFDNLPSAYYTVIVMDGNYCTAEQNTYLDASLGIPSFFTPNGDGFNDKWVITGLYLYPEAVVYVFDRYGKEVFVSREAECEWDGRYCGRALPSDTYWYVIDLGGNGKNQKGCVTIKR